MTLGVKDNGLNHAGKIVYFTIKLPNACYEPCLNKNSIESFALYL